MRRFWIIAILIAGCVHESAEPLDRLPRPAKLRPAVALKPVAKVVATPLSQTAAVLAYDVHYFGLGNVVGFELEINDGERITRRLALEPDAVAQFEQLGAHAKPAVRLYAYWALRSLDPARAQRLRQTLDSDTAEVEVYEGCSAWPYPVNEMVVKIERERPLSL